MIPTNSITKQTHQAKTEHQSLAHVWTPIRSMSLWITKSYGTFKWQEEVMVRSSEPKQVSDFVVSFFSVHTWPEHHSLIGLAVTEGITQLPDCMILLLCYLTLSGIAVHSRVCLFNSLSCIHLKGSLNLWSGTMNLGSTTFLEAQDPRKLLESNRL